MSDVDWKVKHKIRDLMRGLHAALLWAWYLIGTVVAACLWFFPIPQSNLQTFFFLGWFVLYSAFSAGLAKVKEVEGSLE